MSLSVAAPNSVLDWLKNPDRNPERLADLLAALLHLEKQSKKDPNRNSGYDFLGTWCLKFISQKSSSKSSQAKGKVGKVLPSWINIQLSYESSSDTPLDENRGLIRNQVRVGMLQLELSGPWMYDAKRRIMAFDFLFLRISSLGRTLLSIPVRGGQKSETDFWTKPLKDKAFFSYFCVTPEAIAARGRGGGIALWSRVEP